MLLLAVVVDDAVVGGGVVVLVLVLVLVLVVLVLVLLVLVVLLSAVVPVDAGGVESLTQGPWLQGARSMPRRPKARIQAQPQGPFLI